jgi:hypothetical protein
MTAIATIRILCEADTSLGSAIVNGLLAWAGFLAGMAVGFLLLFVFVAKVVS